MKSDARSHITTSKGSSSCRVANSVPGGGKNSTAVKGFFEAFLDVFFRNSWDFPGIFRQMLGGFGHEMDGFFPDFVKITARCL